MTRITLTLILILLTLVSKSQLFYPKDFKPGTTTVKTKYFNGSGGNSFRTFEILDSLGRVIEKRKFKRGKLYEKRIYRYNDQADIVYDITTYDVENPNITDTVKYEYAYANGKILFQKCTYSNNDSEIFKLIKNDGDSILTYQAISYHYLRDKKMYHQIEATYILSFENRLIIRKELSDSEGKKEITNYEYFQNGKLKHRLVSRIPALESEVIYVGGPGNDDQTYYYTYDNKGRIKKYFAIIGNKTYKLATHHYTQ